MNALRPLCIALLVLLPLAACSTGNGAPPSNSNSSPNAGSMTHHGY
ncbi:hypothetical protein K6V72_24085 [Ralstonia insidiosa]|uniref:Lipoprotein n=1 Tax=Ralstonia insidiosa TaxID=190721 RepID=A0A848P4B1_9RALS|nr:MULTISPECIES: hypothetical protein [Ralstonia]ANH74751.1 putative lipoprotein [Ralstonia insidiosa]EPX96662.1 hypothetical protein C404_18240 [Ralstonia sp. AU12-08]MBY4706387.1 hypothetical protein [Ralstonia insidiosa]MBY4912098.1 hypothetical protein [Ralstonia insidiosa]NMV39454.1 hypothetical protein [Ralstonia insidiosa]